MKAKHPNLPRHIIKFNTHFYKDTKNGGKLIHRSQLARYCPIDEKAKHEEILSKRYDLRQD